MGLLDNIQSKFENLPQQISGKVQTTVDTIAQKTSKAKFNDKKYEQVENESNNKFCQNCGTMLNAGAKFCHNCGSTVENYNDETQEKKKTVFVGEIHKCPNCGETLNSYISMCPSCGYEIRDTKATYSIQQFFSEINRVSSNEQKAQLIRNFPIPNAKEDIMEFMILASSNITSEQDKVLFEAWCAKFEQAYQKAELTLQNDKLFIKIQELYDKTYKGIQKERAKQVGRAVTKGTGFIGKFFLSLIKSAGVLVGIVFLAWAVNIDTSGGNSSRHEVVGVILLIASSAALLRHNSTFLEIFIAAAGGVLSMLFATFLWNGSMLELGGAVTLILVAIAFFKRLTNKKV